MGRFMRIAGSLAVVVAVAAPAAGAAPRDRGGAASLCVGRQPGCYGSIQAAVDAAPDGATITVGPGTFAGGVTIAKSLTLRGVAAAATVISGGGPVLTIGTVGALTEPTVSLSGVTITDGFNTAPFALGGGVSVPPSASGLGATVTISDSVVSGNRAAPASTLPGCFPFPFAGASGGGIDNFGTMTLERVLVSNNEAGSAVTSDADGGGILNERGASLALHDVVVSGNTADVVPPNGRFAAGGGIFARRGSSMTIDHSTVLRNTVDYRTSVPADNDCGGVAQGGGIKIGGDPSTNVTIADSTISQNSVRAASIDGDLIAFGGGIEDDGTLTLTNSTIADNRLTGMGPAGVFLDSGGIEVFDPGVATISGARITGNTVAATAGGEALAQGGAMLAAGTQPITIDDSVIVGNSATSTSLAGPAKVEGAGLLNGGLLLLDRVQVSDNAGRAKGGSGHAQGGGIWNGSLPGDGFPVALTAHNVSITRNALQASAGLPIQGGGLYAGLPAVLIESIITKNAPDNCFGC
jgi:Right handed beta helix region